MFDDYGNSQVHTTPSQPPAAPQSELWFDKGFVTTTRRLLKLAQLVLNFAGFLCVQIQWSAWIPSIFYNILYWLGIVFTSLLLLLYTFHFVEKYYKIPWHTMEFVYSYAMAFSYFVLSIMATTTGQSTGIGVSVLGFCAVLAYGYDGHLSYKGWTTGLPAQ